MKQTHHRAFTLIEVLVMICIVAILAVLLTTAGAFSRDKAKNAKSISNLRQIAIAMQTYAADNGDLFPRGYFFDGQHTEVSYINDLIPYLSEIPTPMNPQRNIFISPTSVLTVPSKPLGSLIPMTYSVHGLLCADTSKGDTRLRRSLVPRPSQVILIADGGQDPASKNAQCTFKSPTAFYTAGDSHALALPIPYATEGDTSDGRGQLRYRAGGAVTAAMVDGHIAVMKKGTVTYANVIADH